MSRYNWYNHWSPKRRKIGFEQFLCMYACVEFYIRFSKCYLKKGNRFLIKQFIRTEHPLLSTVHKFDRANYRPSAFACDSDFGSLSLVLAKYSSILRDKETTNN